MTLDNPGSALIPIGKLGHVALPIAEMGEPFGALRHCFPLRFGFEPRGLFFEDIVKKLLRRVWPVNFLDRFQQIERELMAIGLKKIMAAARKPVNHFRATHSLWPAPGIEVAIALKGEAMLLDATIAHAHFFHQPFTTR